MIYNNDFECKYNEFELTIEKKASEKGRELSNMTLEEMDMLWEEAKERLK